MCIRDRTDYVNIMWAERTELEHKQIIMSGVLSRLKPLQVELGHEYRDVIIQHMDGRLSNPACTLCCVWRGITQQPARVCERVMFVSCLFK